MKVHRLKTWQEYMMDVAIGKKPFELRKNDRDFQIGDELILEGWDNEKKEYTGSMIEADVIYILKGGQFGLEKDYVIMTIKVTDYNF